MYLQAQMPAGTEGETQLTQVVLRGLGDKLYDKRKAAALEVEQLIKNLAKEVGLFSSLCTAGSTSTAKISPTLEIMR